MVIDQSIAGKNNGDVRMGEQSKGQLLQNMQMAFDLLNFTLTSSFTTPSESTFADYRRMLRHPSIALARIARRAPMKSAGWSYEATEDSPQAEAAQAVIKDAFEPIRRSLVADMLAAEDFGFAPFEIVYGVKRIDGVSRTVPIKFKPLLPEKTKPLIDKQRGEFVGVKNFDMPIPREKVLWWKSGDENGNIWGIGANERAHPYWRNHAATVIQSGKYVKIASVPVPLITYPPGQSKDASGSTVENSVIAERITKKIQEENKGVIMPDKLSKYVEDMLAQGRINLKDAQAWRIDFLEIPTGTGSELINFLQYFDKMMIRAWLVPERAVIEGEHGTKAEAGEHASLAVQASEDYLGDLVECINHEVVDTILVANFGPEAKGMVRIKPQPIVDERRKLLEDMVKAVLTHPANVGLFMKTIAMDQAIERLELPVNEAEGDESMTQQVMAERLAEMQGQIARMRGAGNGGPAATMPPPPEG